MEGDLIKINRWLLPFSWLYGIGVKFRNLLFETGFLRSYAFKTPVISVGNLTVGGTGKTPLTEYIINLLYKQFRVAVVSRGYKRRSKGLVLAKNDSTVDEIGDELFQIKQKYPDITLVADAKRVRAINFLLNNQQKPDVIILDDAYQHRYVKPGINILLVDYHRIISQDKLLPAGRLREPISEKIRASIVIVTKCPADMSPIDYRVIKKSLSLYPFQQLFFATISYQPLKPLFINSSQISLSNIDKHVHILLLIGIALPKQMKNDISKHNNNIHTLVFPDHHNFTVSDQQLINDTFAQLPKPCIIITTEKDAARLSNLDQLSNDVRQSLYVLPLRMTFLQKKQQLFNENITNYVQENKTNS